MATPIPSNRAAFTLEEIAAVTSGTVLASGGGCVSGVVTDSRAPVQGQLFVALRGDAFDGHAFVATAIEAGAAGVLVERAVEVPQECLVVRVDDTLTALGQLASHHRRRWGGRVVAIGGSAGKTTTRGAVTALLEQVAPGTVAFERGNLNNRVGVPMVLLRIEAHHRMAVVEIGTNQTGEVSLLAELSDPNVAILTLVDLEHTEGLGDLDAIEREEGALLAAVGTAGAAVANVDDLRARRQLGRSRARTRLGYGRAADSSYRIAARQSVGLDASLIRVARPHAPPLEFRCRLCGEPGALAATAAIAVVELMTGRSLGAAEVEAAFDAADVAEAGRLAPIELGDGTVVIDDTYNSNPASARSSIRTARELAAARGGRLVLVLGEMRELGRFSEREHRRLGADLVDSRPAFVVGVAGHAKYLVAEVRAAGLATEFAASAMAALNLLRWAARSGDVVLVKASRGLRAEEIVAGLVAAQGAQN